MSVYDDQGFHVGFMWENLPWCDLTNSDNLVTNQSMLDMKSMNHTREISEGEVLANKKKK
jgi:hypothetical protein